MGKVILENESFLAEVNTSGCELARMVRKSDGREFIWNADPAAWKRHAPVLFPLIGQYKNNTSIYNGKEYHMTQHGFARDMEFTIISADSTYVAMSLTQNEQTREKYPFDFELICSYRLEGNSLIAGWEVKNPSNETIYFSIGGHPAFIGKGDTLKDAEILFETDKDAINYELLTAGLVDDPVYALALDEKKCAKFNAEFFDKDALIVENNQCSKVSLVEDGEIFVTVEFDAPVFGIWSAAGKNVPFACIEPWYGRSDRKGFEGTIADREWGNSLKPGEVFKASYTMSFF